MFLDISIIAWIGFFLAANAVLRNDCVQTLGTCIVSCRNRGINLGWLGFGFAILLVTTLLFGWGNGDAAYGRLNKIEPQVIEWYHLLPGIALLILTRHKIPVSTTFMMLSVFAGTIVLEKMVLKSVIGLAGTAAFAFVAWWIISKIVDERNDPVQEHHVRWWIRAQFVSTIWLFYNWATHDSANFLVFLPRGLPLETIVVICMIVGLIVWHVFYTGGGPIQEIVKDKTSTRFVRSAVIIDIVYGFVLFYLKGVNEIPMSTTWAFVGLLLGREFALYYARRTAHKSHKLGLFPLVRKDIGKMFWGLVASLLVAVGIGAHPVLTAIGVILVIIYLEYHRYQATDLMPWEKEKEEISDSSTSARL